MDEPGRPGDDGITHEEYAGCDPAAMDGPVEDGVEPTIQAGNLAGRSLTAAILIVGLPVLIQHVLGALVGLVDKMLAGGLAADVVVPAMDGLGVGSYIGWFIGIAMAGMGIGGQAVIARAIGRGDVPEAEQALGHALGMGLIWGVVVGAALWFTAPLLATVCRLDHAASIYCVEYVRWLAVGVPGTGVMIVGAMCLVGAGDTLRPAVIAVAVNVVNVVLSWALSGAALGPDGTALVSPLGWDMAVGGIAAGTALANLIGGGLTCWVVMRGVKDLRLAMSTLKPCVSMMKRVVRVGLPNFAEGISMWSANLVVLWMIGVVATREMAASITEATGLQSAGEASVGAGLAGAHVIAIQWEAFSFLPGFAIGTAAASLAGQYLGAGNLRMARRSVLMCTAIAMVLMALIGVVFMMFGRPLTDVISVNAQHREIVPQLLLICGMTQVFFAVSMVVRQALRGVGDTTWTFLITTVSSYGIRLPAAWILGVTLGYGLPGIWMGLCGEIAIRATLFFIRFQHGGWAKRDV